MLLVAAWVMTLSASANAQVRIDDFDSIKLYTLSNASGMTVRITNYGATVTSIVVPDRDGKPGDVALGYNRVEDYINAIDRPYFGAVVGRYGNRIAGGRFTLDENEYTLATNNGDHHLHGGLMGFDKLVWKAEVVYRDGRPAVAMTHRSRDGEEGYPGNLDVTVLYQLADTNTLVVTYTATTDKPTPVNLTQHTYFNLRGEGDGDVLGHSLHIHASRYTPVDGGLIPTGELRSVDGTPFDFRTAKPIGQEIGADDEQLRLGGGYDHNFVLDEPDDSGEATALRPAATVYEPTTGRVLTVSTTEPGLQLYTGNFLDGRLTGKSGRPYGHRGGFCLETQHFPDSPNRPEFPSTILRPGQTYRSQTVFQFSTRR